VDHPQFAGLIMIADKAHIFNELQDFCALMA